jgi:hypothetical protein
MRSRSVQRSYRAESFNPSLNNQNNIRRNLTMRTVRTLALILSIVVLTSSLPAFGADRAQDRDTRVRDRSSITVIVKRIVKRLFGIATDDGISVPKPDPSAAP